MADPDVIVVGAGAAGCVVARRLVDAGLSVVLLEAGPLDPPPAVVGLDPIAALDEPGWTWPGSDLRGRGLGGGSAVNGMVLMAGDRSDVRAWGGTGLIEAFEATVAATPVETVAHGPLARAFGDAVGPLSGSSSMDFDVDGLLETDLAVVDGKRATVADLVLLPLGHGLELRGDVEVTDLVVDRGSGRVGGGTVRGVEVTSGGRTERLTARHVVLACGALRSPALTLSAGLGNEAMGVGLKDHPAVAFAGLLVDPASAPRQPASVVLRWSSPSRTGTPPTAPSPTAPSPTATSDAVPDLLTVPFESIPGGLGLVLTAAMRVEAQGRVTPVRVDRNWLDHPSDRRRLRHAVRTTATMLADDAFAPVVRQWFVDDVGAGLDQLPIGDEELDGWLADHLGGMYHAGCSARFGAAVGPAGVVLGARGLSIIDAAVLPDLPACNPQVAVMAFARWLADDLAGALGQRAIA